jgi:hypothetical protein
MALNRPAAVLALVGAIVALVLSPGLLLNIPAIDGQYLRSGRTSMASMAVHAVVFAAVFYLAIVFFKLL